LNEETSRALIGGALALALVIAARARRTLTLDGALVAAVLGTVSAAAGWSWAFILVAFFLSGTLLSRIGEQRKIANTDGFAAKGGERDAFQVLANGGLFGVLAVGSLLAPSDSWIILATGAIAASTSDTWATEVGTLLSRGTRSIVTFQPVHAGTSGGVSAFGTLAAFGGALFIAAVASAVGLSQSAACAALAGGIGGSMLDSVLGATLQSQRRCPRCETATERTIHTCGEMTTHERGLRWLDNDGVNTIASLGGAAFGALCLL
jgi:uncharacterized protein (TIGR00297 family)